MLETQVVAFVDFFISFYYLELIVVLISYLFEDSLPRIKLIFR